MEIQIRINKCVIITTNDFDANEKKILLEAQKKGFIGFINNNEAEISIPYEENMINLHKFLKTPKIPLDLLKLALVLPNTAEDIQQPVDFVGQLLPHQIKALSFAMSRKNCLLALEMGAGKTAITIALLLSCKSKRALIIVPASLKNNWKSEIEKFAPSKSVLILKTTKHAIANLQKPALLSIFIVSYSLLDHIKEELKLVNFDIVIGDEAHFVKTAQAKRSKVFKMIGTRSEKIVLLTGTPGETHQQLYNLIHIIAPLTFNNFHHYKTERIQAVSTKTFYFGERYCVPTIQHVIGNRKVIVFKKSQRAQELQAIISPYVLTMRKQDILNLPDLQRERVTISELSKNKKKFYEEEMARIEEMREKQGSLKAESALMELVRETMRLKSHDVCNYLKMLLSTYSEKIIVFFHHSQLKQKLIDSLDKISRDYICIDGKTPMNKRSDMFSRFKTSETCQVAILSLQACSTGLNLQYVNLILFAELVFSSTLHTQAEARAHRYGQKNRVICQYLVTKYSTDEMIWRTIKRKAETQATIMSTSNMTELVDTKWGETKRSETKRQRDEFDNIQNKKPKPIPVNNDEEDEIIPLLPFIE
jgi:SWI/SNF-related matrix-associated actin-dependent regulator 1 of chromatin subfamily A